jgi:2,3-bisphosphoglycerate-independent phosphoglycerate mutase
MTPPLPFVLVIMDGYANNPNPRGNAVHHARKPHLDRLFANYPTSELITFGEQVGLPDDQMGNSEVGHLNIGAGRIVEQELTRINRTVRSRSFGRVEPFAGLVRELKNRPDAALHLIGLMSTGGVHSHIAHAQEIVREAIASGVRRVYIHAITDGRARPPAASAGDIAPFESFLEDARAKHGIDARIVSAVGRYFAMDRDSRWERTEKAYQLFTSGGGDEFPSITEALERRLAGGSQDEFLEPLSIIPPPGGRSGAVQDGDAVLFFNFRADRMRQIVQAFLPDTRSHTAPFKRKLSPKLLSLCTLTEYDEKYRVLVLFPPFVVRQHLGAVVAEAGYRQLRIAETEKYAHVTYFFSGGDETTLPGEERILRR